MTITLVQNELPEHIDSPLKFLSVISKSPDLQPALDNLLGHTHLQQCETSTPLEIIDTLAASKSKFYSVTARSNNCTLKYGSLEPTQIYVTLDEHTFSHHSYIGRLFQFKQIKPFKGSVEVDVYYKGTIERGNKFYKDFEHMCRAVFTDSNVEIISDIDLSQSVDLGVTRVHDHKKFTRHDLKTPIIAETKGQFLSSMDSEDTDEIYEFMSLVHLNAIPDVSNSHVAATSMYEVPALDSISDVFSSKLYSYTVSKVNPLILYELANMPEVVSVQAVSSSRNYLLLKSEHLYNWTAEIKI